MVANQPTGAALGDPEPITKCRNSCAATARGSNVSLGQLLERVDVEGLIGDQLLQPSVLRLEFLQALGVTGIHAAVLRQPPVWAYPALVDTSSRAIMSPTRRHQCHDESAGVSPRSSRPEPLS